MKSMPKWFVVPPAVAALLILGTLSMQSGAGAAPTAKVPFEKAPAATAPSTTAAPKNGPAAAGDDAGTTPDRSARRDGPAPPRTPDLWQMASALAGVLLLGIGGVLGLRKLRGGAAPARGASLLHLRQSLRLSARQAIHAIEFDDRIVLVGETASSLVLLDAGKLPEPAADEVEIARRASAPRARGLDVIADDADGNDGAVPKDLVIPRPPAPLPRRLPSRAPTAAAVPPKPAPATHPGLADFRNLLQKAGRA